jgi:simple sugar transport system permease protein
VEGFQGFGAFIGSLIAILLMPVMGEGNQAIIYIAMLGAAAGGGLYACLHALLCIRFRANQVISGVVVNILAVALTTFLTSEANQAINKTASNKFILGVSMRFSVPYLSDIPWIGGIFKNLYPFEIIIIALVLFFSYLMYKTRFGMMLRACGENPQAVDAAGGDVEKTRWIAVIISGALSGIGGICPAGKFIFALFSRYFSPMAAIPLAFRNFAIRSTSFVQEWNRMAPPEHRITAVPVFSCSLGRYTVIEGFVTPEIMFCPYLTVTVSSTPGSS